MQHGKVKMWDASKGFGFISTNDDEDIFVNVNDLHASVIPKRLTEGQKVTFDIRSDFKGERAVNVRIVR